MSNIDNAVPMYNAELNFNRKNELNVVPETGSGIQYIGNVCVAYFKDNNTPGCDNHNTGAIYPICEEILIGLGAYADTVIYKVAIVRKLEWLIVSNNVFDILTKMDVGNNIDERRLITSACMVSATASWSDINLLKVELPKVLERLGIKTA